MAVSTLLNLGHYFLLMFSQEEQLKFIGDCRTNTGPPKLGSFDDIALVMALEVSL